MTITREQLEKAAKAAGIEVVCREEDDGRFWFYIPYAKAPHNRRAEDARSGRLWSPHESDDFGRGQLLDLAIACKICIEPRYNLVKYQIERTGLYVSRSVNCQDFPALVEAVILACCEQFDAKEQPCPTRF